MTEPVISGNVRRKCASRRWCHGGCIGDLFTPVPTQNSSSSPVCVPLCLRIASLFTATVRLIISGSVCSTLTPSPSLPVTHYTVAAHLMLYFTLPKESCIVLLLRNIMHELDLFWNYPLKEYRGGLELWHECGFDLRKSLMRDIWVHMKTLGRLLRSLLKLEKRNIWEAEDFKLHLFSI